MDLTGKAYNNLPYRLRRQANNVEQDGWLNAARLMRNAADTLLVLHNEGVVHLDLDDESDLYTDDEKRIPS